MVETVTKAGPNGAGVPDLVDPHEREARDRWKIYTGVFVALFVLTIMELYVNRIFPESERQVGSLVALMLAKATLVVLYYMHLRWDSRVLRWLIIIPFFAAVFFVFIMIWL
jgi:cytochrome c oxidase subunit 4